MEVEDTDLVKSTSLKIRIIPTSPGAKQDENVKNPNLSNWNNWEILNQEKEDKKS